MSKFFKFLIVALTPTPTFARLSKIDRTEQQLRIQDETRQQGRRDAAVTPRIGVRRVALPDKVQDNGLSLARIHDPVLRNPGLGIFGAFGFEIAAAILAEHFDDQVGALRVVFAHAVGVLSQHEDNVRLPELVLAEPHRIWSDEHLAQLSRFYERLERVVQEEHKSLVRSGRHVEHLNVPIIQFYEVVGPTIQFEVITLAPLPLVREEARDFPGGTGLGWRLR